MKTRHSIPTKILSVILTVVMVVAMIPAITLTFSDKLTAKAAYASFSQPYSTEYYYASGTKFIYQTCLYYSSKDNSTATNWLSNNGWTPVGTNFNAGDGKNSNHVHLGVKYTTDPTQAVTAFAVRDASDRPDSYSAKTYGGSTNVTWYKVGSGAVTQTPVAGDKVVDLNSGGGGDDLTLYVSIDRNAGCPVTEFTMTQSSKADTAQSSLTSGGFTPAANQNAGWQDCNAGQGGDFLYAGYKSSMTKVNSTYLRAAYSAASKFYDSGKTSDNLKAYLDGAVAILTDLNDGYTIYDQGVINTYAASLYVEMANINGALSLNTNYATPSIAAGGEIWYAFTPTESGTYALFSKDAQSDTMDPVVSICTWQSNSDGSNYMKQLATNDDASSTNKALYNMAGRQSYLEYSFTANQTYWICWKHYHATDTGVINFRLSSFVTLKLDSTNAASDVTKSVPTGISVVIAKAGTVTRTGHTLIGWATNGNANQPKVYETSGVVTMGTSATTIYALWAPSSGTALTVNNTYNAVIDAAGEVEYFEFTPTKTGKYLFYSNDASGDTYGLLMKKSDWASGATTIKVVDDNGTSISELGITNNRNFIFTEELTAGTTYLYGVKYYHHTNGGSVVKGTIPVGFEEIYSVKYDANGGSGAPSTVHTKYYNRAITLDSTTPTRTGYTFKGWATSSSATSAAYQAGGSFNGNADTTLYAVWQINTYTITFKGADGTTLKTQTVNYNTKPTAPTIPSKASDSTNHYTGAWDKTIVAATADTTYTVKYTGTAHSFTSSVTTAATCTSAGTTKYTCSCGYNYTTSAPAAKGHSYGAFSYDGATAKTHTKTCANDSSHKVTENCTFTSAVTKAATCATTGVRTYTCSTCGGTYTETIAATGNHSYTVEASPAVAATCAATGKTAVMKCATCTATTGGETIAKLTTHTAGTAVVENKTDSTCTATGTYDEVVYCTVCKVELSRTNKTIDKKAHTEEAIPAVEATCATAGSTAGTKCKVCGTILTATTGKVKKCAVGNYPKC